MIIFPQFEFPKNKYKTHAVIRGVALTLASTGNSSAFIAQGRGPNPNEKAAM